MPVLLGEPFDYGRAIFPHESEANAILRLPAGPEWNGRLERLMAVPVRKDARFPVSFDVQDGRIRYVTLERETKEAPLDTVDRELTLQLNRERRVPINLP